MGLILSYDSGGKMNSKDLKRMTRAELLEVLLTQSRRIRELEEELEEAKAKLERRGTSLSLQRKETDPAASRETGSQITP